MEFVAELRQAAESYLASNQFASGGLFIGLTGGAIALARRLPGRLAAWAWRQVTVEIEITNEDDLFFAVEYLLAQAGSFSRQRVYRARFLNRAPKLRWDDGDEYAQPVSDASKAEELASPGVVLTPGLGRHWLWRNRRLFLLTRQEREKNSGFNYKSFESFTIHALSRDIASIKTLLDDSVRACHPPEEKRTRVLSAGSSGWRSNASLPVRNPDSLVLRAGLLEDLVEDVRSFYGRKPWYQQVGVPYRRGYLLAGPPGNGKTTTVAVLAGIFGAPVCVLDLGAKFMDNETLLSLLTSAPMGAFIVLEDIDAMFRAKGATSNDGQGVPQGGIRQMGEASERVTFSGLLNALDGVATPEGRLVFMSSNHPECLDPALIRPGRVDRIVQFENADEDQASRMMRRFFPDQFPLLLAERFAKAAGDGQRSMAEVQDILVRCDGSPEAAVTFAESCN